MALESLPRTLLVRSAVLALLILARSADAQTPPPPTAEDLFNDGVLHEIRLFVNPRDWKELKANFQLNDYYASHFLWNGYTVKNVGIRSRGLGSRSGVKPGLRVDFDHYNKSQTFLDLKSLVLRNNTQDPSNLHERLSMRLFSKMGIPASRTAHTRLFVNDEYVGLYLIVESVDKRFLKRHFGEDEGYSYKYDYVEPYYFDYKGSNPALYSPQPFQPETHEKDPDPKPLVDMIRAINETSDATFLSVVGAYVDLNKFMIQAAVENFLADNDGLLGYWGINNFYLYRFWKSTRSTIIPWDKSEAFKGGVTYSIWQNIYDVPPSSRNRLMDRAIAFPELRDVYLDALLRCAAIVSTPEPVVPPPQTGRSAARTANGPDPAPGWLEQEILRAYEQIRQAALADELKPFSNEEFEGDIAALVEFVRSRSAFVIEDVARSR